MLKTNLQNWSDILNDPAQSIQEVWLIRNINTDENKLHVWESSCFADRGSLQKNTAMSINSTKVQSYHIKYNTAEAFTQK